MRIAVPKEHDADERRVALVPEVVRKLSGRGIEVAVERGAGERALISDAAFEEAGAVVVDGNEVWKSDAVITIAPPKPEQIAAMNEGALLIGFLAPLTSAPTAAASRDAKVTAFAMEAVPRTAARRQSTRSRRRAMLPAMRL